jgi:hypothetical protein
VSVVVPTYWRQYGPGNFLWFSDVALLASVPALWFESPLIASNKGANMTNDRKRKPPNRDQDVPRRKGESIESPVGTERGQGTRERNAPLPEEETYEREPRDQRPRSWREVND